MIQTYDSKQTAKLLGISFSSVRKLMKEHKISYHRVGPGRIIFTESDIQEFLDKNVVKTTIADQACESTPLVGLVQ